MSRPPINSTVAAVKNCRVVTGSEVVESGWIRIRGGKIDSVGQGTELKEHEADVLDANGAFAFPGLIDTHTHGVGGHGSLADDGDSFRKAALAFPRHGVTAFCLTIPPASWKATKRAFEKAKELRNNQVEAGAEFLGIHWESPFTNVGFKGAFDEAHMKAVDLDHAREIINLADGTLAHVTVAPELPNAENLIMLFQDADIPVGVGHSGATWEQASATIKAGVRRATHLFNAMTPFSHREPGVVGAFLDATDVWVELIADGCHVHPAALRLVYRMLGADAIILVTDSIHAAGTELTEIEVAPGMIAEIREGRTWLPPKGILVGSVLTLEVAVRNMRRFTGASIVALGKMACYNAARALGRKNKGGLMKGCDADIVLFDDELALVATIARGKLAYERSM